MTIWFELTQSNDGQFHFSLKSENGTLVKSEAYTTKAAALNGIESVKKNAEDEQRYERKESKNGKPMFNLKAGNHQIIGTSPMFADNDACETAINLMKRYAHQAEVKNLVD